MRNASCNWMCMLNNKLYFIFCIQLYTMRHGDPMHAYMNPTNTPSHKKAQSRNGSILEWSKHGEGHIWNGPSREGSTYYKMYSFVPVLGRRCGRALVLENGDPSLRCCEGTRGSAQYTPYWRHSKLLPDSVVG